MKKKYITNNNLNTGKRSLRSKPRKRKNSNVKIALIFILLFAIVALLTTSCSAFSPPKESGEVMITIEEGASLNQIAEILQENKVIKSENAFKIYCKIFSDSSQFKAGGYLISRPIELKELAQLLGKGSNTDQGIKITIPEGYVLTQIATILEENGLGDKAGFLELAEEGDFDYEFLDFEKSPQMRYKLEGFIYPETYYFDAKASNETIIKTFLSEFDKQVWQKLKSGANGKGYSPFEMLTLASIVEKEAVLDSERAKIAGVFYNRLKIDMKLESCATIQYALGREKFATFVTIEETQIDSPYNLYKNTGLTPGPICNPGLKSIEAVINPESSEFLFFVAKGDGSHHFSKTYEEHLQAQQQYGY